MQHTWRGAGLRVRVWERNGRDNEVAGWKAIDPISAVIVCPRRRGFPVWLENSLTAFERQHTPQHSHVDIRYRLATVIRDGARNRAASSQPDDEVL